jgi:tetratricopeptide (TPR) repeat protein
MVRTSRLVIAVTVVLASIAGIVAAQNKQAPNKKAQSVSNQAIADLAAWRNQQARSYLQKQKAEFGSTPEFQTAWALLEIQDGAGGKKAMFDRGMTNLSKMTKVQSVSAIASYYHGEILYQQKKRNEANPAWQAAATNAGALAKKNPTDATAQFYAGAALVRTKKFPQARDALLMAVRGGFDPAMVNHQIGLSFLFAESWMEARKAFDLGLAVNPRYAPMYFWRAMAWEKLGHKDKMLLDLDQYLKLAPNGPEAGKAKSVLKSAGR